MKIGYKWLLVHMAFAALGAAFVWAFSPPGELIPSFIGVAFAFFGSATALWPLIKGE